MTFDEYSKLALTTDLYKGTNGKVSDPAFMDKVLGLTGESGEIADKCKKILRDQNGVLNEEDKKAIIKEMGDVLWYMNSLSAYIGSNLEQVAKQNLDKVLSRKKRGKLGGSGDNR